MDKALAQMQKLRQHWIISSTVMSSIIIYWKRLELILRAEPLILKILVSLALKVEKRINQLQNRHPQLLSLEDLNLKLQRLRQSQLRPSRLEQIAQIVEVQLQKQLTPEQIKIISTLPSIRKNIEPLIEEKENSMPKINIVIEDILNDALIGLAAAASIFVKNPAHQQQAGNALSVLSQLVQTIDQQLNPQPVATTT